ncbi:tRNA pseudouridine(55) synthase TruB [candidate division KSB1 bacterium]|nr:tRNA pseudouridine(55) synthase TruB [candidate division KSB1 bacterium]
MDVNSYTIYGILNLFKAPGWTSFDVVRKITYITRIKKVGHAGTLDPFASGVLLITLGRATKQITRLQELEKEYVCEIQLGTVTDTLDVTGKVIQTFPTHQLDEIQIEKIIQQFVGEIEQVPPQFSAIKIKGKRAYQFAREGKMIELAPRKIQIYGIDILEMQLPIIKLKICCAKGTYIRSLARDIGEKSGCGGFVKSLVRTRIGPYRIEDSLPIERLVQLIAVGK